MSKTQRRRNLLIAPDVPTKLGEVLNNFVDAIVFGRHGYDVCHRSSLLLAHAFKPIWAGLLISCSLIGFIIATIRFFSKSSVLVNLPFISIRLDQKALVISCIFLLGVTSVCLVSAALRNVDRKLGRMTVKIVQWVIAYAQMALLIFACMSVNYMINIRALDLTILEAKVKSLSAFSVILAAFGAGFVNFFHLRTSWAERWTSCFQQFKELQRVPEGTPEKKTLKLIFLYSLICQRMFAHPSFAQFFRKEFRKIAKIKRRKLPISETKAKILLEKQQFAVDYGRQKRFDKIATLIGEMKLDLSISKVNGVSAAKRQDLVNDFIEVADKNIVELEEIITKLELIESARRRAA